MFTKSLKFDLINGFLKSKALFLCPLAIGLTAFVDFAKRYGGLAEIGMVPKAEVSYSDCWLYLYGGIKEYIPGDETPFIFPTTWIVVFILISFLVLNYPLKNLQEVGQQILLRSRSRMSWWFSKCCWNVWCTAFYHALIGGTLAVLSGLYGFLMNRQIHMELIKILFQIDAKTEMHERTFLPWSVFLLPIVISIAINLFQMTLSLFIKPVFSFLVTAVLLISSAYLLSPLLIGNYAMLLRQGWLLRNGVPVVSGYVFSAILIVGSMGVGFIRFKNYDILNRE